LANPVVLIAEDDADIRETLRELLKSHDYDVLAAQNSVLAYSILLSTTVQAVLVDIMMPGVDGLGLIRWIRDENPDVPIVAMTAHGEEVLKEALAVGASAQVKKPLDIPRVPEIVDELLGRNGSIGTSGVVPL